ncbi:hypothetical protein FBEOM_3079 [Fusarium beomiforme]|uniref:Uncharacterized protein n=1 Tax=Fusarium beomiforme TaxID=44412 RepID=A0A9P5E1T3_9HYPO|nr:hypothetical protein FBEOM_3079 [Fusarium beomiforme]
MASEEPPTQTTATSEQKPAKSCGLMLAPYIYDTDSVQEHLLCRAVASDTTLESNERVPETIREPNDENICVRDLEAMMREPSSLESRL